MILCQSDVLPASPERDLNFLDTTGTDAPEDPISFDQRNAGVGQKMAIDRGTGVAPM
jgi:hypothetical protein